jgi:hypothetical protein
MSCTEACTQALSRRALQVQNLAVCIASMCTKAFIKSASGTVHDSKVAQHTGLTVQTVEADGYLQIGSMIRSHLAESRQRSVTYTWMHATAATATATL